MRSFNRTATFALAIVTILSVTSMTYATTWQEFFAGLFGAKVSAQETAESQSTENFATGVCESLPGGVIEVEGTGGSGAQPTGYPTLAAAFTAINGGAHTGTIVVDVCGNTTEGTSTSTINASGAGAASYTSITISPAGGASRTISGATTAGNPMIDMNGADNVTFNGLNTGGNSLTIANTTASATSGTSTFRFIGGATNNTITNSDLQGSVSSSVATNGAVIFFSTDAVTTNGNDNNTISNNNIGPAGANLPTKAILGNGSTTTTAIGNSGIVINNNNIFDFFGAAVTSSGIATNGGSNTWTITNNRLYQTGTRTWTTGSLHVGIDLRPSTATSGAQGHTVTGNIIGYASNTQTGIYTLTGAGTGAKFVGILHAGISTGTVSNINNNTIAAVSMTGVTSSGTSTASPFMGIHFQEGNGVTNGNTIGSQSATGSLTFSTTTTSGADVYGIYNFSSNAWTSNNNNVGGISVTNLGASGTFALYGLRANTGGAVLWNASGNIVGGTVANSMQLAATGVASQVIGMHVQLSNGVLATNTVRNMTTNIGTGTGTGASMIGISASSTSSQVLSVNNINNLSNTNATAAVTVSGIHTVGGGNVTERNSIYGLTVATNNATAEVNGIRISGGANNVVRNNMIALGAGITNAVPINGINEVAASTANINHNSIYIAGSPTAGAGNSFALNSAVTASTRNYRNNIFFNARSNSGATGKNYAVRVGGTAPNPAGMTIDNNIYFANGTGAVFGFFNSLDVANLTAWKTAVGQDAVSFESNPQFNDPTNAVPDLHLHPTNPTLAEGNGSDVGVLNDFDGQTRASFTPVDIGADAGNFSGIDLSPPTIVHAGPGNTSSTGDRTLQINVTDASGIPGGSGAPGIMYRKNVGPYFGTSCSLVSGSTYNCVINAAALGGLTAGDLVHYYFVAQDNANNVIALPSAGAGGYSPSPPSASIPPTTPFNYAIVPGLTGSLNVGSGEAVTSLTNVGGAFEIINNSEVTGNLTINLTGDTVEFGAVALNEFAPGFQILIKPSGGPRQITGSNAGALIRLNGADNVKIDGWTSASLGPDNTIPQGVGGVSWPRELTITNNNTGTSAVVMQIASNGSNGAQNNVIQNAIISGQSPTTSLAAIAMGGTTPGTAAAGPNNGNRIENCQIMRSIYGIYTSGQSAAAPNTGTVIRRNFMSATTGDRVRRIGFLAFNENGIQITENSVNGISTDEAADAIAIGLGTQGVDATLVATAGAVTNALVSRNIINGVASTSATGFSAAGIAVAGGNTGSNTIANNMITGVVSPGTSPDFPVGIFVAGVTGSITRVYHNSVAMTGSRGTASSPQIASYGIAITGTDPAVELKNNIFYTTQTSPDAGADDKSFAIGMTSSTFANLDSNFNLFFSSGANDAGFRTGGLNTVGTDHATLAAWQTAVSDDANSIESDPIFTDSTNDLHLQPGSPAFAVASPTVSGVDSDIDNDLRDDARDIGADEAEFTGRSGVIPTSTYRNGRLLNSSLNGEVTFNGGVTIDGIVTTGENTLRFNCNVLLGVTSGYVDGNLRWGICAPGSYFYPVGQGAYSPVNVQVTAVGAPDSLLTITANDATLAGFNPAQSLSRNWTLIEFGDITANLQFVYDNSDVNGNENDYRVYSRAGSGNANIVTNHCMGGPCVLPGSNSSTVIMGISSFSRWTMAQALTPTAATVDVSGRVMTADGRPIRNVQVAINGDELSEPIYAYTGNMGYYNIEGLPAGRSYVLSINSKRFSFNNPIRLITPQKNLTDQDFVADPQE